MMSMWWQKTSKRYLRSDIFKKYYQLMQSSTQRTRIIALQKLNELLRDGYVLLPDDGDKLDTYLLSLLCEGGVGDEKKDAIRRCAYRLCARRYNFKIRDVCLRLLGEEICFDNKMSVIPVLSQNMPSDQFNQFIPILESHSGLTYQQIKLAQFACPNFNQHLLEKDFINNFLNTNDITALRFLPIIFNEQPKNFYDGLGFLNNDLFGELANHDDPWVQKYALGTFSKMTRFHIEHLKIDPSKFLSLDAQPQKWVMTDIFLDRKFIKHNQDLVRFILSEHHLFTECDSRVKEGIAQGLLRYGYNAKLAEFIISWYAQEKEASIKVLLRSYMMASKRKNKEFNYILTEEIKNKQANVEDSRLYLPGHIQRGKPIFLLGVENRLARSQEKQKKGALIMINRSFNRNKIGSIGGNYIGGNVNNSTVSIENSIIDLQKRIDSQGGADTEELKEILEDVKELIENIESSRLIPKQKQLFKKLSDHASKHGWFYAEIVSLLGQHIITMLGG